MPYLPKANRPFLDAGNAGSSTGELTYTLQQACMHYLEEILAPPAELGFKEDAGRPLTYDDLMCVVKALEGAKIDFIGRILQPYEERKRIENGDVWHPTLLAHLRLP